VEQKYFLVFFVSYSPFFFKVAQLTRCHYCTTTERWTGGRLL